MDTLAIVIPTLNEAVYIRRTLEALTASDCEIVVSDGGSTDGTRELVRSFPVTLIEAPRGRAAQMNAGASHVNSDSLLFLHADTELPDSFELTIKGILEHNEAGAFRLAINNPTLAERLIAGTANLRARFFGLSYGDQAIFTRRSVFDELGGYKDIPFLEDLDLVNRLNQRGRFQLARDAVITSERRWRENGVMRTTIGNQIAVILYFLGVSPEKIASYYKKWMH